MIIDQFEDNEFEDENWDDGQEDGSFEGDDIDEQEASSEPAPKKSSMGLVIVVLILGALGGGGYYYIKIMGGSVPFLNNIPGLSQLAQNNGDVQGGSKDDQAGIIADALPMPQVMTDEKLEESPPESMGIETLGGDAPFQAMEEVSEEEVVSNDFILPEALSSEEDGAAASENFETSNNTLSPDMGMPSDMGMSSDDEVLSDENMLENTELVEKDATPEVSENSFEMAPPISEKREENNTDLGDTEVQAMDFEETAVNFEEQMPEIDPVVSAKDSEIQVLSKKTEEITEVKEIEEVPMLKEVVEPKVTVKKKTPKRKIIWVLKSAKPGKAWISEKGVAGMRVVSVGDKVDGIGQVTSIGLEDGKWVVKAKAGRISQ